VTLTLLAAAAPKGPLDTWSPTLLALFSLLLPLIALLVILAFTIDSRRLSAAIAVIFTLAAVISALLVVAIEVDGSAWGLAEVYGATGRRFDEEDVAVATEVAQAVAARLKHLQAHESRRV